MGRRLGRRHLVGLAVKVAVLFARGDSIYKTMRGCDVYDIERDARTFDGSCPVVAHPPCRAWGRLRQFAKPVEGEKELAFFAVDMVRQCGGVLEHPSWSTLWAAAELPKPGQPADRFGGRSIEVRQHWWGHKAEKKTWLYFVGIDRWDSVQMPIEPPTHVIRKKPRPTGKLKSLHKKLREATPPAFAEYLVRHARRARRP